MYNSTNRTNVKTIEKIFLRYDIDIQSIKYRSVSSFNRKLALEFSPFMIFSTVSTATDTTGNFLTTPLIGKYAATIGDPKSSSKATLPAFNFF